MKRVMLVLMVISAAMAIGAVADGDQEAARGYITHGLLYWLLSDKV